MHLLKRRMTFFFGVWEYWGKQEGGSIEYNIARENWEVEEGNVICMQWAEESKMTCDRPLGSKFS